MSISAAMASSRPVHVDSSSGIRLGSSNPGVPLSLGSASRLSLPQTRRNESRATCTVRAIATDPKITSGSILGHPLGVSGQAKLLEAELPGTSDRLDSSAGALHEGSSTSTDSEVSLLRRELLETKRKLAESEGALRETLLRLEALESQSRPEETRVDLGKLEPETKNVQRHRQSSYISRVATAGVSVADLEDQADGVEADRQGRSIPGSKTLKTTGQVKKYAEALKQFWYPVAFSRHVDSKTLVPIECFDEPWVLFRGADGRPGCIRDECAHRACPLSLGTVEDGRVACAYHGWEFSTKGVCEKMPSTKCTSASVPSLPCIERDGMIWIWASREAPPPDGDVESPQQAALPGTLPPSNYVIHAELVMELPVEYGLLVENLLDLAHAPFTHTSTFARGWSVPDLVRFKTAASMLKGHWDPYPIAMEFRPPCIVVSTIGLAKPGQLEGGQTAAECSQHLFQMHACVPSSPGSTRLLYRMGLDFGSWVRHVPFIDRLWTYLAGQVLDEDLRLVLGQQDRMRRGANVWNHPVLYDKLGVGYRRWRNALEGKSQ